ncbi:MAG: glycosyltransferase [Bacteroidia bacterium]|nr:glycosyltransferase [Bacteroidia bacterium]MDW8301994.1 glycosyltransferase [Bacteroidia bacterium]
MLACILAGYYVFFMTRHAIGLKSIQTQLKPISVKGATIIVPVRNDAAAVRRLLPCLLSQSKINIPVQILIVDDHSNDNLYQTIQPYLGKVEYLALPKCKHGKKHAIEYGIAHAKHEIIVTTDADCVMQKEWLHTILSCFGPETQFVSGPVLLESKTLFETIQQIELMGLVGIGAGAIYFNQPNLCNGANIAYRKDAFHKVNGYAGSLHLASGDDELLMHKIHTYFNNPQSIVFCKDYKSIVFTPAQSTFRDFLQQRKRWVSKATHYQRKSLIFQLILIYLFYLMLFISTLSCFWNPTILYFALFLWVVKLLAEWSIIGQMMQFFKCTSTKYILIFAVAQLFQLVYVIWAGLVSLRPTFTWKERTYV